MHQESISAESSRTVNVLHVLNAPSAPAGPPLQELRSIIVACMAWLQRDMMGFYIMISNKKAWSEEYMIYAIGEAMWALIKCGAIHLPTAKELRGLINK